jgi:hypothetical protein
VPQQGISTTITTEHYLIMSDPVTTFTWSINTLERYTADGIVYTVHYNINATDGTYSEGAYGSVGLQAPPEEGYDVVAYDDLTEELVLQWTKSAIGGEERVTEIQNALQERIDQKRTPTTAQGKPF